MRIRRAATLLVVAVPAAAIALLRRRVSRRRREPEGPPAAAPAEVAAAASREATTRAASREATTRATTAKAAKGAPATTTRRSAAPAVKETGPGDDLKVIEGIGPRIEEVLRAAGITTYAELADQSRNRLETIMKEAGTRLANPETWAEQAGLAAAGDWDALRGLQGQLKRGRRASS